jgi:hypothetical protein
VYRVAVRGGGGGVEVIPVPSARLAIQALQPPPGAKKPVQHQAAGTAYFGIFRPLMYTPHVSCCSATFAAVPAPVELSRCRE